MAVQVIHLLPAPLAPSACSVLCPSRSDGHIGLGLRCLALSCILIALWEIALTSGASGRELAILGPSGLLLNPIKACHQAARMQW